MSEILYTRCPYCRTAFRTNAQQLSLRDGKVRCGQCRKVFNARGHLVKLDPSPFLARPEYELDEGYDPMKGPQTMTLHRPVIDSPASPPAEPAPTARKVDASAAGEEADRMARASFAWAGEEQRGTRLRWLYASALPLLLVALVVQAGIHFRSYLAAAVPDLKLPLQALCERIGCRLEPMREASALTVEASDLQADPAHRGLMILSVTLRNHASYALAFPHLELTLTDIQAQAVVRRIFEPVTYVRDALAIASGIPAGEEKTVKLFLDLDASAIAAEGYKIERYYP